LIELVLRIGFSLLIVFGLLWGLARVVRRPIGGRHGTGELSVLNRQQLSRGSAVAVVQVADRAFVLGVTDQQVSLLAETDLEAFEKHPHEHRQSAIEPDAVLPAAHPNGGLDGSVLSPRTWSSTLNFLRDRTTRH
jgi:flagellar protein FliO/FliZ